MSFTQDKETDNYITFQETWNLIKPYIPQNKKIWSPFYCDGKQKIFFKEMGFDIIHNDEDFFKATPEYDIVIDNPPFSKIKDILKKLKKLDKPFILICPAYTFQYKFFQRPFGKHLQLIIPDKRLRFRHLTKTFKGGSLPNDCYFFCYKMNLHKDLIFL